MTSRARVERLNNARKHYQTECRQCARNQSTINEWLLSYTLLHSGQLIGPGLSNSISKQYHVIEDDDETTDEFEFEWDPGDEIQDGL